MINLPEVQEVLQLIQTSGEYYSKISQGVKMSNDEYVFNSINNV